MINIKKSIKGIYLKLKYGVRVSSSDKVILINIEENKFNRYLFPFVHMISSNGYKPILLLNFSQLAHLSYDKYQKMIFDRGLLFVTVKNMNIVKTINLSPDYFNALNNDSLRDSIIPMPMHPSIYSKGITIKNIIQNNKNIFFAGTTIGGVYNKRQVFEGIISRFEVLDYIKTFKNSINVKSKNQFERLDLDKEKSYYMIYERHNFNFTQEELFIELTNNSFFLALPGTLMPLCHNIIEAMYCRAIPILQDVYAHMFPISLKDGVNCLIFKDFEELSNISKQIDQMTINDIENMQNNVINYYKDYLSESAITNKILTEGMEKFYLQAEGHSVTLYNN
ncbi:hypothetical protein ACFFVB_07135 [Formosa undariae]|uniref:Exostosin family protein n=1 Tax=Formosa undariae TaxID=1325436 RepID=A0ABV5F114_9FLAO